MTVYQFNKLLIRNTKFSSMGKIMKVSTPKNFHLLHTLLKRIPIFQHNSAPALNAQTTQCWSKENLPNFITFEDWPFRSPDLTPLYCWLRVVLKDACLKRYHNIESLKCDFVAAAALIPPEPMLVVIDEWLNRLKNYGRGGGYFSLISFISN